MLTPKMLKIDDDPSPQGLDAEDFAFSWTPVSDERAQRQSAYQILVASSPECLEQGKGELWDSGKVKTDQTTYIAYSGKRLSGASRYFWAVRLWDAQDKPSAWSNPACFQTGLFKPSDWQGAWIGNGPVKEPRLEHQNCPTAQAQETIHGTIGVDLRSLLLRRAWFVRKPVKRAQAFVCGLGYYVFTLNGQRVGNAVMTPSKTDFRRQLLYDAYDVTDLLRKGENVAGLMLGNGWYNPNKKFWDWRMQWHGSKRAIFQLKLEYADACEVIVSGDDWKTAHGPILTSCIYDGETYDAREELPGWDAPGFDDAGWTRAVVMPEPGGVLRWQANPPIRVTQTIRPAALWEAGQGVFIFDMGQNFSGWCRLTVQGNRGEKVALRFAENIRPDGALDTLTNKDAANRDVYILKGRGIEIYEPSFAYHGFQYVEMTGFPGTPTLDSLLGCATHSDNIQSGEFNCGNALINRIQHCTIWSQRSNMMGMPTDDNQRDERLGWMGDAHVTTEECLHNFDAVRFYRKWLRDIKHGQNPETGDVPHVCPRPHCDGTPCWSSAYHLTTWYVYQHTGDKRFLEEHIDGMAKYVDFLSTRASNGLQPRDRYGDWLSTVDGAVHGDPELASTFYYYYDAWITAQAAREIGKSSLAKKYADLTEDIRAAFQKAYYQPKHKRYGNGRQSETAMVLLLSLHAPEQKQDLIARLKQAIQYDRGGSLNTGILGTKYLFDVLPALGEDALAWQIATNEAYPGFAAMIRGRSTLSERWDQRGTNNHVMFGSISHWFYRALAGIRAMPGKVGFQRVRIQPYMPASLPWAAGAVQTVRGRIATHWAQTNEKLKLQVEIPANIEAEIALPLKKAVGPVFEGGNLVWQNGFVPGVKGLAGAKDEDGMLIVEAGSGCYVFECNWHNP